MSEIEQTNKKAERRPFFKDIYLAGSALTALRTGPMIIAEIIGGIDASKIFFYRAMFGLTNFAGGYAFKEGRELGYKQSVRMLMNKFLPSSIVENEKFDKNIDKACGVAAFGVETGIGYGVYKIFGVNESSNPTIPAIVGSLMTLFGGGWMGCAIDTHRDANRVPYHKSRSIFSNRKYFPVEPSQQAKKTIIDRVDLAAWGTIAAGLLVTNRNEIMQGLEQLLK